MKPITQHIAITLEDGSLAVMQLVLDDGRGVKQVADATIINREIARTSLPSPAVSWRLIESAALPTSRRWRNCWRDRGQQVEVDMPLAREQRLAELRIERDAELAKLDKDWMRASGQGKDAGAAGVEAKRQALRDMPVTLAPMLAAANTPDELDGIVLELVYP